MSTTLPPALLTMPSYAGTLAAVRCLGEFGVHVTVAGGGKFAAARWSKYARRVVGCPTPRDPGALLDWLLRFGEKNPGTFLYPTSDDLVWLISRNQTELRKHFLLYAPPFETYLQLIDKKRMYEACVRSDIDTVETWFLENGKTIEQLAGELPYPLMLKPRTQSMLHTWNKGEVASNSEELMVSYRKRIDRDDFHPAIFADLGDVKPPMLQRYYEQAVDGVYSVAGFVDADFRLLGARASVKVLQRPRRVGVGLCFQGAELKDAPAQAVQKLCAAVGYSGVFEAEFIVDGDRFRIIDFNPRFYGQMGFELGRGLPLAQLALLAATGDREALLALAAKSRDPGENSRYVYCDHFYFSLTLAAKRMIRSLSAAERAQWLRWYEEHRPYAVDASASKTDPTPGIVHAIAEAANAARHLRGFIKGLKD